ncbi:MAG: hypothetical protein CMJ83_01455 [Planctomycetes bacterium]|nr:hypothetical protein [Planctomycetota bacterium]
MTDSLTPGGGDEIAHWPGGREFPDEEALAAECEACGLHWRVHQDLGGSRLQCRCSEWVDIPVALAADEVALHPAGVDPETSPLVRVRENLPAPTPFTPRPSTSADGGLIEADVRTRQKWTDRTVLELALMMLAFLGPQLAAMLFLTGGDRGVYMPLTGAVSAVLVFIIAFTSHQYAFEALRRTSPRYFVEGLIVTAVALGFAWVWIQFIKWALKDLVDADEGFEPIIELIGLPMAIFAIGVVPGIFEELAFRGLVQGRLNVLFGTKQSILVTGAAFALAHGMTLGLPIHIGLGWYLCWLRARCGSLLPGMMLHFLYNSTLVATGW